MVFMYVLAVYWVLMLAWMTYFFVVTSMRDLALERRAIRDLVLERRAAQDPPTQQRVVPCGGGGDGGAGGDGGGGDGAATTTAAGALHADSSAEGVLQNAARSSASSTGESGRESSDEDVACTDASSLQTNAAGGPVYTFGHDLPTGAPPAEPRGAGLSEAGAGAAAASEPRGAWISEERRLWRQRRRVAKARCE